MDSVLKSEVFFFITTIAVGVFTIVGVVIAIYFIKILRNIHIVSTVISRQCEEVSHDIDSLRAKIKQDGQSLSQLLRFFARWFGYHKKRK